MNPTMSFFKDHCDWVFETDYLYFRSRQGSVPRTVEGDVSARPILKLRLITCDRTSWDLFKEYHYKTEKLSARAFCFVLANQSLDKNELVGFVAVIPQIGNFNGYKAYRAHRTVILPTWQGMGLGSLLSDLAGELFTRSSLIKEIKGTEECYEGLFDELGISGVYFGQTVHPMFGTYRHNSQMWQSTKHNRTWQKYKIESWKQRKKNIRVLLKTPKFIYSHRYVGRFDLCNE